MKENVGFLFFVLLMNLHILLMKNETFWNILLIVLTAETFINELSFYSEKMLLDLWT